MLPQAGVSDIVLQLKCFFSDVSEQVMIPTVLSSVTVRSPDIICGTPNTLLILFAVYRCKRKKTACVR